MYDRSNCGRLLRRYMCLSLAWWHNYKWAVKQIVRVFSSDFIVPMFHHLFPDNGFVVDKISHTSLVTYLTYIRLSYKNWRQDLANAIENRGMTQLQRTKLVNLRDLCEFFIPVVSISTCIYIV